MTASARDLFREASTSRPGVPRALPQRGFSLVEIVVVMTVLGIVVATAAPAFNSFLDGQQAKSMTYDLTTDLLLARSEALKRNLRVSIVSSGAGLSGGWTVVMQATNERIGTRNAAAQTVSVLNAPATITFDENGRVAAPSSDVRITVTGGGSTRCVELDLSGRARTALGACPS